MNSNFSDVAGWCVDAHVCFGSALFRTLLNVLRFLCAAYTSVCCLLERRMHTHTGIDTVARRGGNKRTKQNEATEIRLIYNVVFFLSFVLRKHMCHAAIFSFLRSFDSLKIHNFRTRFLLTECIYIYFDFYLATSDDWHCEQRRKKNSFPLLWRKIEQHRNSHQQQPSHMCVGRHKRERVLDKTSSMCKTRGIKIWWKFIFPFSEAVEVLDACATRVHMHIGTHIVAMCPNRG